jgi:hypothetical protein
MMTVPRLMTYQERQDIVGVISQWFDAWQKVLRDLTEQPHATDPSTSSLARDLLRMNETRYCASQYLYATTQLDLQLVASCGVDVLRSMDTTERSEK